MTKKLNNWSYRDVTDFLKENGFSFFENLKDNNQAWIKTGWIGEPQRIVELRFRRDTYPVSTLRRIIRQSGIQEGKWLKTTE